MNAAMLAELWACCMIDTFVWHAVGEWKEPLFRLLSCSNQHQVLTDTGCLGQFLHSWFTNHEPGTQQDSAEFVGWLRHAMHGDEHGGQSTSKWEARLEAATEDSGHLYAPILLQQTKDGVYTIQDLINLWHDQAPFHCGFTTDTTTVGSLPWMLDPLNPFDGTAFLSTCLVSSMPIAGQSTGNVLR